MFFQRPDVRAGRYTANYPDDFVVGVWHETYRVEAGQFEAIYANMPRMSLAAAGEFRELSGASRMRDRVGKTDAH